MYARASFADRHLRKIFGRGLRIESPAVSGHKVLGTKGGTDNWEVVWELQSETTAPELLKLLDRKLTTDAGWSAQGAGQSADRNAGSWKFVDETGESWDGAAGIRPVAGATNKFTLAVRVNRAARTARRFGVRR